MSISPRPVEQAASFLKSSSATPKEKLVISGKLLWAATMLSKDWPSELLDQAKSACKCLFKHGNMKTTVEQMTDEDASRCLTQFTEDVTQLAIDIEQARSQNPLPRTS